MLIYFWLCWVFIAACGLSLVAVSGGYFLMGCSGFLLRWFLLLQSTGFKSMGLTANRFLVFCFSFYIYSFHKHEISAYSVWDYLVSCGREEGMGFDL